MLLVQSAGAGTPEMAATQADAEAAACRQAPQRHCLLRLAATLADGLDDDYSRKSTLARIVEAQAGAGDISGALETAGKIANVANSLIPSPLATIAEAQAANGDIAGAFATTRMLSDGLVRVRGLIRVAEASATAGDSAGARQAIDAAVTALREMPDDGTRAGALARIAAAAAAAGDPEAASRIFDEALAVANAGSQALGWVAEEQAAAGFIDAALATAKRIENRQSQSSALAAVAAAQAAAGNIRAALATAATVEDANHQVDALAAIALAQAAAGDVEAARQTSLTALVTAHSIAITWEATSYFSAMARAVQVQAAIGEIEAALESVDMAEDASIRKSLLAFVAAADFVAARIEPSPAALPGFDEPLLRALTLAAVARAQQRAGDVQAAQRSGAEALTAAIQIDETAARATLLVGLADTRAGLGDVGGLAATLEAIDALPAPLEELGFVWSPGKAALLLAKAQTRAGDIASALATAEAMDGAGWQIAALLEIATALSDSIP
jgi:tetratricopeptide (TPR) repeat protein